METISWSSLISSAYMFIFTITCLSSMIHTSEAQHKTDQDEERALIDIFRKLGISATTWNMSIDPCSDNNQWSSYITCDCSYNNRTLCHITELSVDDTNSGKIPEELQNLTQLTSLDLSQTSLTGPLPSFIGYLTKLRRLRLGYNSLSGAIPKELGNLTNLNNLDLEFNSLSGFIPKELGNLRNLNNLNLGFNSLSGFIPKELGNLRNLNYLDLGFNSLSGFIPKELGNLRNLNNLYLSSNSLNGTIPKELGILQNLKYLYLSSNSLNGTIPKELGNLQNLQHLALSVNSLSGIIPKELGNLQNLQYLNISDNALNGTIPEELGNLRDLTNLDLSRNSFKGTLPSSIGNLINLQYSYISSAGLSGQIPSSFANLTQMLKLTASDNNFTGKLPDFIGTWTNLTSLILQGNAFEGPIPSNFSNLVSLDDLRIGEVYNGSSSLEFTRNMIFLRTLILRNCMITDSLPSNIGNFSELEHLDLSFNNISGSIPQSLFNLSSLEYLFLGENNLTGTLPTYKSSSLTVIDISYNYLNGRLPSWATNNIDLQLNLVANNFKKEDFENSRTYRGLYCIQRDFPCNEGSPKYSNFAVNSGGPRITDFDEDDKDLGAASFYVASSKRWAVSSAGIYLGREKADYIIKSSLENCDMIEINNSFVSLCLAEDVRVSAGSLRYYGLRLINGYYTVTLKFSEIDSVNESTQQSRQPRVFDIYIQGELKRKDFVITNATRSLEGVNYTKIEVNENFLEIHLFWAGKGMGDFYGPSIAAVSAVRAYAEFNDNKSNIVIIAIPVLVGIIVVLVILIALILRRKMSLNNDEELLGITFRTHTFSYAELKKATDSFDPRNKLGEGGFGPVYKGILSDGRAVAVKQLSLRSPQGKIQFVTEIDMISAVQHRNLVKLYGCCIEGQHRLLVYEYMENKSLDQALFGKNALDLSWKTRFEICVGTGRGLAYLHEESRPKIVHRDVKASNILLDANLKPKLSDFGLAKLYDESITHISTRVAGTVGYLAPEYAMKGHLTEKADVFGFGVALLEILSGRPNFASNLGQEEVYLLEWAWLLFENRRHLEIIDPKLKDFNKEEANRVFIVGLLCTQLSPTLRPSMSRVVSMLLGDVELTAISSKPSYFNDLNMVCLKLYPSTLPSSTPTTISINNLQTRWTGGGTSEELSKSHDS